MSIFNDNKEINKKVREYMESDERIKAAADTLYTMVIRKYLQEKYGSDSSL